SDMQRLPLPFPDTEKKAVITPAQTSQRITVLLEYEWFETYFTLYAVQFPDIQRIQLYCYVHTGTHTHRQYHD
ncbi:MAG: hypothetical protein IJW96_00625, partial [Clostridia bacterium]|nr:hypothetical protein [Clostridia bacterium]